MSDDVLAEESGQVADEAARPDDSAPIDGSAGPIAGSAGIDGGEPETELQVALRERDELRDIAMRLQADFENYRKRVTQQAADDIDRATGRLAEALLPVLDACEAAFAHGADGVEPVWSALIGALQKQGLEALDLLGKPFDPAVAEAVVHEPGEGGDPVVAEVLRTGYAWKGRVLRAAMVKVRG